MAFNILKREENNVILTYKGDRVEVVIFICIFGGILSKPCFRLILIVEAILRKGYATLTTL